MRTPTASAEKHGHVSPARRAAFDVLQRVESSSAHSDDLLHGAALKDLSQADKNLTMALVLGVLRWQIALDAEMRGLLDRPEQPLPEAVLLALRLAAFQLLHMDRIPAHAALSEGVELVRAAGHPNATGLVNAVLRKLTVKARPGARIFESVEAFATRLGHPAWMVDRWARQYGRAAALAICEYDQQEPSRGEWFAAGSVPGETGAGEGSMPEPTADAMPGVTLIDDGSRLVAELAAVSHAEPQRIWDACAAPGGKTQILAQRHCGAEVLATDISARRLQAMRWRLEREMPGHAVETMETDAARLPESAGRFDLILCDVPCSGTGTLARNPEIRVRLQAEDLERQARRQQEILSSALRRLTPGGRLVYSTCSLEPEENEAVVQAVMNAGDVRLVPVGGLLERLRSEGVVQVEDERMQALVRGEFLRTLPGANFAGDGFFAAVLERG
jgi:16S rRNA (cytosine967-C5)-methyltransferase